MKKYVAGILIVVVIVVAFLALQKPTDDVIKIGFIGPLSGGSPVEWGQGSLNMIQMAADEINAEGGIGGRKLLIVPEDGKCQSQPSVAAAQKLVSADSVKFILGGHCSVETSAIAPILEENSVFGLAGVTTATGILNKYSYVFRTSPPNDEQGRLIAKVAIEKYNATKAGVIVAKTTFTQSIADEFIMAFEKMGGKVVAIESLASETTDFRTSLIKIKSLDPDVIFISTQGNEGLNSLRQVEELGINMTVIGPTTLIQKKFYDELGGRFPEKAFTVATYVDSGTGKASVLVGKYRSRYGTDVPYNMFFVGASYDGMYMLKDALEACGEDPGCVRDYFFNIKEWEGSVATFSFEKTGDPIINNWRELVIENGEEVFREIM